MIFQEKGFFTPPPGSKSNRNSPLILPRSSKTDLFHVIHKVPSGDSPYVRAKRVQLIDKDPCKAVSLFWAAINSGDRVDSALKDMAVVMKQLDRSDEAIEAIKSFRHLCPPESQESLDNVLLELYKRSGRYEEEIQMMHFKLNAIEEDFSLSGKRTKISRFQGKKIQVPIEKEYIRLLGNLAWSYLQRRDYKSAEVHYRKALSFELDKNKQCNLAICLIQLNKLSEAELLLQTVKVSYEEGKLDESSRKSFERAAQMLDDFHSQTNLKDINAEKLTPGKYCTFFSPRVRRNLKGLHGQSCADQDNIFRPQLLRRPECMNQQETMSLASAHGKEASPSTTADNTGMYKTAENGLELSQPSQQLGNDTVNLHVPKSQGKSWADMVEEEENGLLDDFADENRDSNIIMQTPYFSHQDTPLKQQNESLDSKDCYYTQPLNDASLKTQVARRSLCFDQHQKADRVETCFSSPLINKNLDFAVQSSNP